MVKTFNCPACGGPLVFDREAGITIRCPYCHNTVIVPDELIARLPSGGAASTDDLSRSTQPVFPRKDPKQVEAEIRALLGERQKINAIKLYRQATGAGLKQAKEAVESIEAGGGIDASFLLSPGSKASPLVDDASAFNQAVQLVRDGNKIEAIRLLRNQYDVSLKVAKDAADLLEKGQPVDMEWLKMKASQTASPGVKLPPGPANRGSNSSILWGCLLGLLLVLAIFFVMNSLR